MEDKSKKIRSVLVFLFWFSFISCCIGVGVFMVGYLRQIITHNYTLKIMNQDFSTLLPYGLVTYHVFVILNLAFGVLLTILLYQILQLFRLFKVADPFNKTLSALLIKIARYSLYCAYLSVALYAIARLTKMPHLEIESTSSDIFNFLLMAGVLYLIAIVFKKGETLQTENELTI